MNAPYTTNLNPLGPSHSLPLLLAAPARVVLQSRSMLSREEYEERRRQIDEQHQATIALIEADRLAQIRALELVWLASGAGGVPLLPQIEGLVFGARLLEVGVAAERRAPSPVTPEPPRRRGPWAVMGEIERVFEELPEVFGHHDLNHALGYDLDRGSARRNLQLLIEDGVLAAEQSESGHVRLLYRKLRATLPEGE